MDKEKKVKIFKKIILILGIFNLYLLIHFLQINTTHKIQNENPDNLKSIEQTYYCIDKYGKNYTKYAGDFIFPYQIEECNSDYNLFIKKQQHINENYFYKIFNNL